MGENRKIKDNINKELPADYFIENAQTKVTSKYVENYLGKTLPKNDSKCLQRDLKWQFILHRHKKWGQKSTEHLRKKRNFLTRKERNELNLLKLPKTGWNYQSLDKLRSMWKDYMRENLDLGGRLPNCKDQDWASFSSIVAKSELIGAEVKIIRSKVPNQVDLSGTIVLESKMTFQIVTPKSQIKTILKEPSVFEFTLYNIKFTFFGKHLVTRPSERSVKKIKTQMMPDL